MNSSNCGCACNKSCGIRECLDYKNCKFRMEIVDELVEKRTENIYGNQMHYNDTLNALSLNAISLNAKACPIISISISSVFIYFQWYLRKGNIPVTFNPIIKTIIY